MGVMVKWRGVGRGAWNRGREKKKRADFGIIVNGVGRYSYIVAANRVTQFDMILHSRNTTNMCHSSNRAPKQKQTYETHKTSIRIFMPFIHSCAISRMNPHHNKKN